MSCRGSLQTGERRLVASLLLRALLEAPSERGERESERWGMLKFGEKRCAGKRKRQARQQL